MRWTRTWKCSKRALSGERDWDMTRYAHWNVKMVPTAQLVGCGQWGSPTAVYYDSIMWLARTIRFTRTRRSAWLRRTMSLRHTMRFSGKSRSLWLRPTTWLTHVMRFTCRIRSRIFTNYMWCKNPTLRWRHGLTCTDVHEIQKCRKQSNFN